MTPGEPRSDPRPLPRATRSAATTRWRSTSPTRWRRAAGADVAVRRSARVRALPARRDGGVRRAWSSSTRSGPGGRPGTVHSLPLEALHSPAGPSPHSIGLPCASPRPAEAAARRCRPGSTSSRSRSSSWRSSARGSRRWSRARSRAPSPQCFTKWKSRSQRRPRGPHDASAIHARPLILPDRHRAEDAAVGGVVAVVAREPDVARAGPRLAADVPHGIQGVQWVWKRVAVELLHEVHARLLAPRRRSRACPSTCTAVEAARGAPARRSPRGGRRGARPCRRPPPTTRLMRSSVRRVPGRREQHHDVAALRRGPGRLRGRREAGGARRTPTSRR